MTTSGKHKNTPALSRPLTAPEQYNVAIKDKERRVLQNRKVTRWREQDAIDYLTNNPDKCREEFISVLINAERGDLVISLHKQKLVCFPDDTKNLLMRSGYFGQDDLLDYMSQCGIDIADPEKMSLAGAIAGGRFGTAKLIAAARKNKDYSPEQEAIARYYNPEIACYFLPHIKLEPYFQHLLLAKAGFFGDLDLIKQIERDIMPNDDSFSNLTTCYYMAASRNHIPVMAYLEHKYGIDPSLAAIREKEHGNHKGEVAEKAHIYGFNAYIFNDALKALEHMYAKGWRATPDDLRKAPEFAGNVPALSFIYDIAGLNINDNLEDNIRKLFDLSKFDLLDFYCERGIDWEQHLSAEQKEDYENTKERIAIWHKKFHMNPPPVSRMSAIGFKQKTYDTVQQFLRAENNRHIRQEINVETLFDNRIPDLEAAYKLTCLFGTPQRVLSYLRKWGDIGKDHPLKELADDISIPDVTHHNAKAWGDAVLKYGPVMAKLTLFMDRLPSPEASLNKTRKKLAEILYENGEQDPELAKLCVEIGLEETDFNAALALWQEHVKNGMAEKNIPDLDIDGASFAMSGTRFFRLAHDDKRGAILGQYVDCCQYAGHENGGSSTRHGVLSPDGGFYVLTSHKGDIIGQSWAWLDGKGALVFDSLETLGERVSPENWKNILTQAAKQIEQHHPQITHIMVGTDGNTPPKGLDLCYETAFPVKQSKNNTAYSDAKEQYLLWHRYPDKLQILKAQEQDIPAILEIENTSFSLTDYAAEQFRMDEEDIKAYIKPPGPPERDENAEDITATKPEPHALLIARKGENIIGYAAIDMTPEDIPGGGDNHVSIDSFAIRHAQETSSLGLYTHARALLEAVEQVAIRNKKIAPLLCFETAHANHSVLKALPLLGFTQHASLPDYYGEEKHGLFFVKDLSAGSLLDGYQKRRAALRASFAAENCSPSASNDRHANAVRSIEPQKEERAFMPAACP